MRRPIASRLSAVVVLALLGLAACQRPAAEPQSATPAAVPAVSQAQPASAIDPASWLGHWVGPEGTLLDLSRQGGAYDIRIQSLDGPATYRGSWAGDHIAFERHGVTEAIRAGNGADTGMKWLADKNHCLVIRPGEGFCRN